MSLIGIDLWNCVASEDNSTDMKRDQKASACICLNAKPHCNIHLREATSAKKAWTKLCKTYQDRSLPRIVNLMRALLKIDYSNFNMNRYISEAINLSQKLNDLGNPIEGKLLAIIILSSL
ncbi:hypothetical protein QLX08_009478 [Tetragonisca angustula]|uniref:Uncharacterized protein n=1 Tax=Tetragonisca angustula TaxID=166442 RepID=A0AAW0ZH58_9HYME